MKILALSGSLRAASINTALLHAVARLAPAGVEVTVFSGLGDLPLFNPDSDPAASPAVIRLHAEVAAADAVLIASPEYAHGVSGVIKNALDWLVCCEPFAGKPVAVINTSPRARHADAALRETLKTMAAAVIEAASVSIPLLGAQLTTDAMLATPAVAATIQGALAALIGGPAAKPPALSANIGIQAARAHDAAEIAVMVGELLAEIMAATGVPAFNFNLADTTERLTDFLLGGNYFVWLARDADDQPVGFIALCESRALYAEGDFGIIPELYVRPPQRSQRVGARLIEQAAAFAKARGWQRLEVTTPPLPAFEQTLAFYQREGFAITGGRKLKRGL